MLLLPGAAGSGGARGVRARLSALLRGRRGSADAIKVEGVTGDHLQAAARVTTGFSGRELAKLMASVQVGHAHRSDSTEQNTGAGS